MTTASKQVMYGGGTQNYKLKLKMLINLKRTFIVRSSGSVNVIECGNHAVRYLFNNGFNDKSIPLACKMVKKQARQFTERLGELYYKDATIKYENNNLLKRLLASGNKHITHIDIDHCYWRLCYNNKIIDEKLYEKFKDNRDARLCAIGNLNKSQVIYHYVDGQLVNKFNKKNELEWVWNYVVYKTNQAISSIAELYPVMSYQTDGFYLPSSFSPRAEQMLTSFDLPFKTVEYTVIKQEHNKLYLKNDDTNEQKVLIFSNHAKTN